MTQVLQATTAAERAPELMLNEFAHHLPVPIGQLDPGSRWWCLDSGFQCGLLLAVEGGGDPPVCSKLRPVGPACRKVVNHSPIVC
jgi:hypothetical protein